MTFRGPRRTEEEDVGFCGQAQQDPADGVVQFDEVGMKIVLEFFESLHLLLLLFIDHQPVELESSRKSFTDCS